MNCWKLEARLNAGNKIAIFLAAANSMFPGGNRIKDFNMVAAEKVRKLVYIYVYMCEQLEGSNSLMI